MKRRKAANAMNDVNNNNRPTDHNGKSEGLSAPPAYPPPAYAPPALAPGPSPLHSVAGARTPTAPPAPPNFGHNPYRGEPPV